MIKTKAKWGVADDEATFCKGARETADSGHLNKETQKEDRKEQGQYRQEENKHMPCGQRLPGGRGRSLVKGFREVGNRGGQATQDPARHNPGLESWWERGLGTAQSPGAPARRAVTRADNRATRRRKGLVIVTRCPSSPHLPRWGDQTLRTSANSQVPQLLTGSPGIPLQQKHT